jgi:hypothetical protein
MPMKIHRPIERPWNAARIPPTWATDLPGFGDLDNEPQIGLVALLQAATTVAQSALCSRHGIVGDPSDEVFEHPSCSAPFIARLLLIRCRELYDLLTAYRIAIRHDSSPDDPDDF